MKSLANKSFLNKNFRVNPREGEVYRRCVVEKLVPGGAGLLHVRNQAVFVPLALPGEVVDISIEKSRSKYARGKVLAIHSSSKDRVRPFCPCYGDCGGCNLQHLKYEKQIEAKAGFVFEHFFRLSGIKPPEDFCFVASRPRGYRQRVQFHRALGGPGFKKRGSNEVLPLGHCPVLNAPLNTVLSGKNIMQKNREVFFADDHRFWTESSGEEISLDFMGKKVFFRGDLFFQSNLGVLPEVINHVLEGAEGGRAMDLYCGTGLFSLFLKERFSKITAIEIHSAAEFFYRKNMAGFSFDFYPQSLEDYVKSTKREKQESVDFAVIDPPRSGLSPLVRSYLMELKIPRIAYVSCNPVTQARDAGDFIKAGYRLEGLRGFDFYPHTSHMETVMKLVLPSRRR